jgi:hypothetical protein
VIRSMWVATTICTTGLISAPPVWASSEFDKAMRKFSTKYIDNGRIQPQGYYGHVFSSVPHKSTLSQSTMSHDSAANWISLERCTTKARRSSRTALGSFQRKLALFNLEQDSCVTCTTRRRILSRLWSSIQSRAQLDLLQKNIHQSSTAEYLEYPRVKPTE